MMVSLCRPQMDDEGLSARPGIRLLHAEKLKKKEGGEGRLRSWARRQASLVLFQTGESLTYLIVPLEEFLLISMVLTIEIVNIPRVARGHDLTSGEGALSRDWTQAPERGSRLLCGASGLGLAPRDWQSKIGASGKHKKGEKGWLRTGFLFFVCDEDDDNREAEMTT
ncbi:UNVERIFIED_CONTAM: hypothetical protein K2H54_035897 [Gekko kuhli]